MGGMGGVLQLVPLVVAWTFALVSPGPDFVVTVRYATTRSRREGALVGLGVASAIAIWASMSMFGLVAVLAKVSWLYESIRLAGALYLAYLGIGALLAARAKGRKAHNEEATRPEADTGWWRAWRVGFLTNIGNPKAAVFFGSLFSALLPAHPDLWVQVTVVALMPAMTVGWYTVVALMFSLPSVTRAYRKIKRVVDAVTGCIFVALAGRLVTE
jgi:threonine efflux protein